MESLKVNSWAKYTDVYIGLDYPPSEKYHHGWAETNDYICNSNLDDFFHSFHLIKREYNYGFERNAEELYHQIESRYDRFIILEDDLEVSPNYLEYMNKCFEEYKNDPNIVAITGYSYPINWDTSNGATCIKQNINAAAWGRGFWKAKRPIYDGYISSGQLLKDINKVIKNHSYKKMIDACLLEYITASVCPWKRMNIFMTFPCDISMRAYLAVANKYIISPTLSKVRNFGFDGSGVYCQEINSDDRQKDTAGTYLYSQQPIDTDNSFVLIPNTEDSTIENHDRLNRFDVRTPIQMRRTRQLIWLMSNIGIWAGKLYGFVLFPYDVISRGLRKVIRQWKQ